MGYICGWIYKQICLVMPPSTATVASFLSCTAIHYEKNCESCTNHNMWPKSDCSHSDSKPLDSELHSKEGLEDAMYWKMDRKNVDATAHHRL